jgi:hypothetical protein
VIGVPFKVTAKKVPEGNYQTESTCRGRPPHTVFKKDGDTSQYKCPYAGCGQDVI